MICRRIRFKAIIFDMDGVITNTMPGHFDAWFKVLQDTGIKVNCYDVYKREGQDGLSTLRELFRERGLKFNLNLARELLRKKEWLFKRNVKIRFIKGARPFLRFLERRKIRLALVTGTSRQETEKILPAGLLRLFAVTVTGNDVTRGKPYPEPFLKAVKAMKIAKKEIAVIENAPFGIRAAKRAKLFCIALETSLPRRYLRGADVVFKSYTELKKAICL